MSAASAPSSSCSTHCTIESPPTPPSPAHPDEAEANVDWTLARCGELAHCLDEHEEVPLVVGHASGVEATISVHQLEGRRVPELERVGRLHVEVRVTEDRRRPP